MTETITDPYDTRAIPLIQKLFKECKGHTDAEIEVSFSVKYFEMVRTSLFDTYKEWFDEAVVWEQSQTA